MCACVCVSARACGVRVRACACVRARGCVRARAGVCVCVCVCRNGGMIMRRGKQSSRERTFANVLLPTTKLRYISFDLTRRLRVEKPATNRIRHDRADGDGIENYSALEERFFVVLLQTLFLRILHTTLYFVHTRL